jgi:hypothetical protein
VTVLAAVPSGTAGPLGFLVVVLIGIAMVLLIRNMNSRLRKLPRSFDEPAPGADEERTEP